MRRLILWLLMPLFLVACTADKVMAPDAEVQRAVYSTGLPPTISLYTMINNRSGEGGHAALLIDASQRVLFDPAGTWYNRAAPEQYDVHFGMTPRMVEIYNDYHARETYHIVIQTFSVTPEVAEQALRAVRANGSVGKARCASAISAILRGLPGFETTRATFYPRKLMLNLAEKPGVTTRKIFDTDADNNRAKLAEAN